MKIINKPNTQACSKSWSSEKVSSWLVKDGCASRASDSWSIDEGQSGYTSIMYSPICHSESWDNGLSFSLTIQYINVWDEYDIILRNEEDQ